MREHLSPEYSFRSFLFTIAKNKFLNDLRNRLTLLSYDEYITQLDATERGENSTESEGLSNQEIALKLGISEQSVRNQLSSALKVLREELIRIGFSFALFFMSQW